MTRDSAPAEPQSMRKTKWSAEEDEQLRQGINEFGTGSWTDISRRVGTRSGKQCRERWMGQLAPSISKDTWHPHEDHALFRAHARHGNQWTIIATEMPGRSALNIKNRWNWLLRHSPLFESVSPPIKPEVLSDVIERRKTSAINLEPLCIGGALFGSRFQEFQAKMFMA
jgi:hypothetical protein